MFPQNYYSPAASSPVWQDKKTAVSNNNLTSRQTEKIISDILTTIEFVCCNQTPLMPRVRIKKLKQVATFDTC